MPGSDVFQRRSVLVSPVGTEQSASTRMSAICISAVNPDTLLQLVPHCVMLPVIVPRTRIFEVGCVRGKMNVESCMARVCDVPPEN